MSKLTFKPRKSSNDSAIIQIHFSYGKNKLLRYSTGLKINNIKNWNYRMMRVKDVLAEIDRRLINEKLDEVQLKLNKRYKELSIGEGTKVTNEMLKPICNEIFNKEITKKENTPENLLGFLSWYFEHYKTNPLPMTNKPMSKNTWKSYKTVHNKLMAFSSEMYNIDFQDITLQFHEDFITWLNVRDYSINYIGKIIKILKTIMNEAFERDLHSNLDFKKRKFNKPREDSDQIYLTKDELKKLYELDLRGVRTYYENNVKLDEEKLNRARDLFLISANTGLRVSDFNMLSEEKVNKINGKLYFKIRSQKGDDGISIPLNSTVISILNKRNGFPPQTMLEQHINYALKILGELAGIDEIVEKRITKGGKRLILKHKKYELISSHTGRRSFCTNALSSGMRVSDIMAITGHKTEKIFWNYVRESQSMRAEKIAEHDFFK